MDTTVKKEWAAIFDMDGILIDSEPLWYEAANEAFARFGIFLTPEAYASSIGLRTKEFVDSWLRRFHINPVEAARTEEDINRIVIGKISEKGEPLAGVIHTLETLKAADIRIGLATSSPSSLINVVVDKLGIRDYFSAFTSAEHLKHGKPHPQVYLDCAEALQAAPVDCFCFEDSFNGMIAAKAARMTCIAIPAKEFREQPRFLAADLILDSLEEFSMEVIEALRH